jgi:SnoaL-like domain
MESLSGGPIEQERALSLEELIDERDIRRLIYQYCQGIDRRDFDLVRSCYHPDATDAHGPYSGDLDGFIEFARASLATFSGTMHFIGNIVIDLDGDTANAETYAITYHRMDADGVHPERDIVLAIRYHDRFEKRAGSWGISDRRLLWEWGRIDEVIGGLTFRPGQTDDEMNKLIEAAVAT